LEALFCTLWGTLLAPLIVSLVVTTYNPIAIGYKIRVKNKQEKGRAATRPFLLYCR